MGFETDLHDNEQRALAITQLIIDYYKKHGKYPVKSVHTPTNIKRLSQWLHKARIAKHNSNATSIFYQSCESLAIAHGCSDMFLQMNFEDKAIEVFRELVEYYKTNDRYPPDNIKESKHTVKLARWLFRMRKGKLGKSVTTRGKVRKIIFYPILDELAAEVGLPDMFESESNEFHAQTMCKALISYFITHGTYPTNHSGNEPHIRSLSRWQSKMRSHKRHGNGALYKSVIKMAEDAGFPDMFDILDRESQIREQCQNVIEFVDANGYPKSVSNHSNPHRGIYIWLTNMRGAKKGTNASIYYPAINDMAIEAGYPNMFNSNWRDDLYQRVE